MPIIQKCIYPHDSILEDYIEFAQTVTEARNCFIIGSILPVCAAILGREVSFPWHSERLYPNVFSILCAKPGDRKTTTIGPSQRLAAEILPHEAFIPKAFSPEALFDEYNLASGGRPDKILIADDANQILVDWQRSANGERNAVRFLELFDCKGFSESFKRNQQQNKPGSGSRWIPETSTSVIFGATFNIARFENQVVQSGLHRRFLYYVAEGLERVIPHPRFNLTRFKEVCELFRKLQGFSGQFGFSNDAEKLFEVFQRDNRSRIDNTDALKDSLLSMLASAPAAVIKLAIIFEACRIARNGGMKLQIEKTTLQLAIDHVDECVEAAVLLETIAERPKIHNDAELVLAAIRTEGQIFGSPDSSGEIIVSRTLLTRRFANNGNTRNVNNDKLYGQVIPYLIQRGDARMLPKQGNLERYAFRAS